MKNLRRVLSFIMAAALSVSLLAVGASADGDTVTSVNAANLQGTNLVIPVSYTLDATAPAQSVGFIYTLTPITTSATDTVGLTNSKTMQIQAGPATLTSQEIKFAPTDTGWTTNTEAQTKTISANATIDLSSLLTEGRGVYRYKLSETLDTSLNQSSVAASNVAYQLDIYVTYNETTKANEISYLIAREITTNTTTNDDGETSTTTTTGTAKVSSIAYAHGVSGTDLKITSHVEGNFLDTDHLFTYTVHVPLTGAGQENNGVTYDEGASIVVEIHKGDTVEYDTVPVSDDTSVNYTVQLKDSEYIVLKSLPVGMIFTVTQTEDADYTTRNTYVFTGTTAEGSQSNGTDGDANNFVVSYAEDHVQIHTQSNVIDFYNKRDVVVDTGVNVEVYPCVLAMTMALCGGALLLAKKKESER